MNIELNHDTITYDHILVRYGELSTKGKNKNEFIKRLLTNIKNALRAYTALTYEKTHDRIYILLNGCDPYEIAPVLEAVWLTQKELPQKVVPHKKQRHPKHKEER